jgi:hypothetical protein
MALESITLELPEGIMREARRAASASRQTVEQVLAAWVRPPRADTTDGPELTDLARLSDQELEREAQVRLSGVDAERLRALLQLQQRRPLREDETAEALRLVADEDRLTLRRARALYLLRQRGVVLPTATAAPR